MCGHGEPHGHDSHGGCCCQPGGLHGHPFQRHFSTREEQIARLEEYVKEVQAEAKAVKERLAEIKAAG